MSVAIHRRLVIPTGLVIMLSLLLPLHLIVPAYAHFEHFTHYNNRGSHLGEYYAYEALEPEYAGPNEPVAIMFSIQDQNGRDTYNLDAMVEIYSAATGERLEAWPWTRQEIGDFEVYYNFPKLGSYQIVLSVAKDGRAAANQYGIDPARTTISSNEGCDCQRAIFNVSITENIGTIWTVMMFIAVGLPLTVVGGVLMWNYRRIKNSSRNPSGMRNDTARYLVMLAAIAGGVVHLAVYAEHASLRLEYSIFLLVAAGMQIVYGVVYTLLTLTGQPANEPAFLYYRKKMAINLFGLVGSGILLVLYAYSVVLPPPLSPNNQPESIGVAGILAKAIEVFTVIGIVYLMRMEKHHLIAQLKEQR